MHCQLGQMERAVRRSGGVGKKVSEYEAGSELCERKSSHIQRHGGRQNQDAEQSKGTYCGQISDEMKELEEMKSEEALLLVQKKFELWRYQNEGDEARRLQRYGSSRMMMMEADSQDLLSFQSCRSSAVDHVEEISLESLRKSQDVQVVMSETAKKSTRGRREYAWRLELEGETETLETKVVPNGVEGVHLDANSDGRNKRRQVKNSRRQSEAPREEGE